MPRHRLNVLAKGMTCTTIAAALVTAAGMISHAIPAPYTTTESVEDNSTQAQDLLGLTPRIFAIGGPTEPLVPQSGTTLAEISGNNRIFRLERPQISYPGALNPLPLDVLEVEPKPTSAKIKIPVQ